MLCIKVTSGNNYKILESAQDHVKPMPTPVCLTLETYCLEASYATNKRWFKQEIIHKFSKGEFCALHTVIPGRGLELSSNHCMKFQQIPLRSDSMIIFIEGNYRKIIKPQFCIELSSLNKLKENFLSHLTEMIRSRWCLKKLLTEGHRQQMIRKALYEHLVLQWT